MATSSGAGGSAGATGASGAAASTADSGSVPAGSVELLDSNGSVIREYGADGKALAPNAVFSNDVQEKKATGRFTVNEQVVKSVKYQARFDGNALEGIDVTFMDGRKTLAEVKGLDRAQAIELLGEENVKSVEAGKGRDKDADPAAPSGRLNGKNLAAHEAFTPDYEANTIEPDREQAQTIDVEVIAAAKAQAERRRREEARAQRANAESQKAENREVEERSREEEQEELLEQRQAAEEAQERENAVPDAIRRKFIQVEEKFYFPDETPAFEVQNERLRARAEHKEVVAALVAIAQARDWDKITVKGTEVFRRAVWLEASARGIEVKGYKPTEVERARLEKMLEKRNDRAQPAVENVIEKGISREASKGLDTTSHAGDSAGERMPGAPLRTYTGKLLEHGADKYLFDPANSDSYYVKIKTEEGEKTIWAKDLERAIKAGEVQIGEEIKIDYMGNKPVTVKAKERDEQGKVIGEREVSTHRNTYVVERAQAFREMERSEAVQAHPELAAAYGTLAAAKKFAEQKFDSKESQQRFVETTKEALAQRIEEGKPLPKVKAQSRKRVKDVDAEKQRKPRERSRDVEASR